MQNVTAKFIIEPKQSVNTIFSINANPTKVSQLENDLNFQTEEQVAQSIQEAVEPLQEEINTKIEGIEGSELIDVSRTGNTVTITSQTFIFEQGIPATEWTINHNLNKRPSVELVYSNGQRFEAYKEYTSNNQVVVRLDAAATGFAYLN